MGSSGPQWKTSGVMESEVLGRVPADPPPALVDQPVVRMAQEHQVVEIGPPAVSPVHDVVSLYPLLSLASRKPAPTISVAQQPGDLTGDRPPSPPNPHHTVPRVDDPLEARIACEAAYRLGAKALPGLGLGEPRALVRLVAGKNLGSSVYHQRGHGSSLIVGAGDQLDEGIGEAGLLGRVGLIG
jgi:hypothetical protein